MKNRIAAMLLVISLLLSLTIPVGAEEAIPIHTVEDLLAMEQNPAGDYILMEDLDMAGVAWEALDFSGTLDGNGHAILNLTITAPGAAKPQACDGNRNLYEATYFGMFGSLEGAQVKNLTLTNLRAVIQWDGPVFLGGIAGYCRDSKIENCTVSGVLELRAHDRIFGIGGLVGYGSGRVDKCRMDVTLINTDTDAETKDEQYLGGIYAAGFINVYDCDVKLDGYISDFGYVHSGGVVGMFMEYPLGEGQKGYIRGNHVSGKITFFEKNDKRRAYCDPFVGEALVNRWYPDRNTQDFTRDEKFAYDRELRPEMCEAPGYVREVTEPDCDAFGYTTYTCQSCGYTYTDQYLLPAHRVQTWTLVKAPTEQEEGLSTGICTCGLEQSRVEPVVQPPETTVPAAEETQPQTVPQIQEKPQEKDPLLPILIGLEVLLATAAIVLIVLLRKKKRR